MIAEFKDQIKAYKSITPDVLDRIEYKTVWSGKRIQVGDKVLYAFVYPMNSDDYKLATFLERELNDVAQQFIFIQKIKGIIPVLKYRGDNLERTPIIEEDYE
jgi:tyrosine-protein phosphatase YwqE